MQTFSFQKGSLHTWLVQSKDAGLMQSKDALKVNEREEEPGR